MSGAKKALIILTPGFPANEADSTCMPFPQLFVKTLKKLQPSLEVIVFAFQYPFVRSDYRWHGVRIMSFNGQSKGKLYRLLIWRKVWKQLKLLRKDHTIAGILNFWLGECALVGHIAARKFNVPSYTWLLGQDAKPGNRYFLLTRPSAQQLVALSDSLAYGFDTNYRMLPAHVVPPGIDTADFFEDSMVRDIDIIGAGSLIPLKQFEIFINLVRRLHVVLPGIKAMICGDGPEKNRLQRIIYDNALSRNIILCGELPHIEVLKLMQRSKIFLHPSAYEGFATVLSEALYAGCQVISFCQPMQTVFEQQHTVRTEDEMIAKAMSLLEDQHLPNNRIMTWPIAVTVEKILSLYGM